MMKHINRALAIAIAIVLMALPAAGFAEGHDLATLTLSNFSVKVQEQLTLDIDATIQLSAGLNEQMDRGMLVIDALAGDTSALQVLLAMEDEQIKGYMQNASGGLSHLIEVPIADLQSLIPAASAEMGPDAEQMMAMMGSYMTFIKKASDPAYARELQAKMQKIVKDELALESAGTESIVLFEESYDAEKFTVSLDIEQLLALTDVMYAVDEDMNAFWQQYLALIEKQAGIKLSDVPAMLEEEGVEVTLDLQNWQVSEEIGRLVEVVTVTAEGESMPITVTMDYDMTEGNSAMLMDMSMEIPDEGDVTMYMEMYDVVSEGARDGYFGMGMTMAGGDEPGTVQMAVQTNNVEATETANATDNTVVYFVVDIPAEQAQIDMSITYAGEHYEQDGDMIYVGAVSGDVSQDEVSLGTITFDTQLQLGSMPEGALLTAEGIDVINPITADEEALTELQTSAMTVFQNAMAIAMQTPGLDMFFAGDTLAG